MRLFVGLLCALATPLLVAAESATTPRYRANAAASHTFTHDGVELFNGPMLSPERPWSRPSIAMTR